jgi:hypothetical protein
MVQTTSRVIKSSDVEVEGRFSLDLGQSFQSGQNNKPAGAPVTAAKVRILENQSEFAVMEVTCCCGRKTIIRCDYGGSAAVKNSGAPGDEPAEPNNAVNGGPKKKP